MVTQFKVETIATERPYTNSLFTVQVLVPRGVNAIILIYVNHNFFCDSNITINI